MTVTRGLVRAAIAVVGAAMLVAIGSQTPAAATARNGVCEAGEICFYYYMNLTGSVSDFTGPLDNYGNSQPSCYEFRTPGLPGYGTCMKNNAESVWNRTSRYAHVYFNSGYCGRFDIVAANASRNLSITFNNNASHQFYPYSVPCHDV
jgi:hypothetical protein